MYVIPTLPLYVYLFSQSCRNIKILAYLKIKQKGNDADVYPNTRVYRQTETSVYKADHVSSWGAVSGPVPDSKDRKVSESGRVG